MSKRAFAGVLGGCICAEDLYEGMSSTSCMVGGLGCIAGGLTTPDMK
jgi:hypothetical protein